MHCGTPVHRQQLPSLPELTGDAGVLVNPLDVNEITAALDLVGWHGGLRELRQKGYRQVEKFTWAAAAEEAMQVLEEAAERLNKNQPQRHEAHKERHLIRNYSDAPDSCIVLSALTS